MNIVDIVNEVNNILDFVKVFFVDIFNHVKNCLYPHFEVYLDVYRLDFFVSFRVEILIRKTRKGNILNICDSFGRIRVIITIFLILSEELIF